VESVVGVVTAVTSAMTGAVVSVVVVVSLSVVVGAVGIVLSEVDSSFTSLQEKRIKLKIMERIMRIYLKELPVRVLGIH
jgi:hypothetical protein